MHTYQRTEHLIQKRYELKYNIGKVVLVLSKMKKVNSRIYLQIHTAIGVRSKGHLNLSFLSLGFGLVIIPCDVKILNELCWVLTTYFE